MAIPPGTTTFYTLTIPNLATNNFANQGVSVELNITDPQDKNLRVAGRAGRDSGPALHPRPLADGAEPERRRGQLHQHGFQGQRNRSHRERDVRPVRRRLSASRASAPSDREGVVGTWQLIIANDGSSSPAGTLNSWSLTFQKPNPSSGLGEAVADQATVSFRIFTMDPTNPLSHSTWTAVGPAGIDGGFNSSTVTDMAVDPSDPSGNIVYAATEGGGVWKTTDFLTTAGSGPTWIPLTDFGPGLIDQRWQHRSFGTQR